jgi:hypothetical protein
MQIPEQIQAIYQQVGGNRAMAMAFSGWSYSASEVTATFVIAPALRRAARKRITHVRVTLIPGDVYRLECLHVSHVCPVGREVFSLDGVYADQLRDLVESNTGLRLSLGTLGAAVAS